MASTGESSETMDTGTQKNSKIEQVQNTISIAKSINKQFSLNEQIRYPRELNYNHDKLNQKPSLSAYKNQE